MTTVKQRAALLAEVQAGAARRAPDPFEIPPGMLEPSDSRFEPMKQQHAEGQRRVFEQNTQTFTLAYETALATLRLAAVERDVRPNCRLRYDRAWEACQKAAQRLSTHTGKDVAYPAWIAPPTAAEEEMVVATPRADVGVPATPTSKPIPTHIRPGSDAWDAIQGIKGGAK